MRTDKLPSPRTAIPLLTLPMQRHRHHWPPTPTDFPWTGCRDYAKDPTTCSMTNDSEQAVCVIRSFATATRRARGSDAHARHLRIGTADRLR